MYNIYLAQVKGFKLNENQSGEYTVEFTEYPGEFTTTETEIRNIPRVRITFCFLSVLYVYNNQGDKGNSDKQF